MNNRLKPFAALCFLACCIAAGAQDNVGIGTLTPNPKAILDLTSSTRGFMVPRMTTALRSALGTGAGAAETGLMVFDTDSSLFYFWNGASWKYFPAKPGDYGWIISGNNMYSSVSGNTGIGTASPTAKLHTVGSVRLASLGSTTTNTEVLTVDANGNVKTRALGNDLWDGDSVNDADADPQNECNTSLFYNTTDQKLTLVDDCGITLTTTIPTDPNDNDKSPTNELQDLSSTSAGSQITVNISGGTGTTFSVDDADADPANELQTLSITKTGTTVNWNLSDSGGSGSFSLDDNDWSGAGTGSMYPSTITDKVGIGTSTPSYRLDVLGDARVSGKQYFSSSDYYIQNSSTDLLFFSDDNMKFQTTGNDYLVTYYKSGTEGIANYNLDGQDVLTMRGSGTYNYGVGIGTSTPSDKLQVAGNVRIGLINAPGFANGGDNYGKQLYFSGGPGYGGGFDSDNDDPIFISRYNNGADVSELRICVGDDYSSSANNLDKLSIGAINSGLSTFWGLFDFEIENPGTSNGPMLSISPYNTTHQKDYHGGLAITKPIGSNGQYINLARGSATTWSIGYRYGSANFAIHEGNTNDAAFATTPFFTIANTTGYVGLGVASPSRRLELPNENSSNGKALAYAWDIFSDGRFKKNREDIGQVLSKVKQLQPLYYQWEQYGRDSRGEISHTGNLSENRDMGFIAQDVYKLFPEVVSEPSDESKEVWSLDYARLTVVLTRAIQEQQAMLEAERDAHQQTKNEMKNLKTEVEQLRQDIGKINSMLGVKTEARGKAPNN